MKKFHRAEDILSSKFGKEGSDERNEFNAKAMSFYFGEIIKERRKDLKLSQSQLADLVGKKRPYISRVENGEDIKISNLLSIMNSLGLKINFIEA